MHALSPLAGSSQLRVPLPYGRRLAIAARLQLGRWCWCWARPQATALLACYWLLESCCCRSFPRCCRDAVADQQVDPRALHLDRCCYRCGGGAIFMAGLQLQHPIAPPAALGGNWAVLGSAGVIGEQRVSRSI